MQNLIRQAEIETMPKFQEIPEMHPGDVVLFHLKITEKGKERTQRFEGIIIKIQGEKRHIRMVTVRKLTNGIGVERIFPIPSPFITKIEVKRKAKVRRANLSYLRRQKSGSKMKVKYKN